MEPPPPSDTSPRPDASPPPDTAPAPAGPAPPQAEPPRSDRHRRGMLGGLIGLVVVVVVAVALASSHGGAGSGAGAGSAGSAQGTPAGIVPADALAYVDVAFGDRQPAFRQAMTVLRRMPDLPLIGAAAVSRVGPILSGGRPVDFSAQIAPWIGDEAGLALLNTPTSTAGSLIIAAVRNHARAMSFVRDMGATADGGYRSHQLMRYPDGAVVGFIGRWLVIGQTASLKGAIDAASGGHALSTGATYTRATAGLPSGGVLTAYASLAGVRRVLAAQGGVLGALGNVLYQPRLAGVALTVVPTSTGAHVRVHTALEGAAGGTPSAPFTPTMASVIPAGASLMLDVDGLSHVAPQVLNAGSAAGIAGGLGPLISRLGAALVAEGVKVSDLTSLFDHESVVAIIGSGRASTLVVAARTPDPARTEAELDAIRGPLQKLFRSPSKTFASPHFVTRSVDGVTAHQIQLTTGLQLDYAVFHGLVVISTALDGIAAVAQPTHPLANDPAFGAVLGGRPSRVTSLVFARLGALLNLSSLARSSGASSLAGRLAPDLQHIGAVGLSATRTGTAATSDLTLQVR